MKHVMNHLCKRADVSIGDIRMEILFHTIKIKILFHTIKKLNQSHFFTQRKTLNKKVRIVPYKNKNTFPHKKGQISPTQE